MQYDENEFLCKKCETTFPIVNGVPDFLLRDSSGSSDPLLEKCSILDDLSEIYETPFWAASPAEVVSLITEMVGAVNGKGLDVGCGTGVVTRSIARKMRVVYGVDISMGMLKKATKFSQQEDLSNINYARCSADNLPFENERFDGVTCSGALHAFPDATAALNEMARIMKPGASLAVMTLLKGRDLSTSKDSHYKISRSSTYEDVDRAKKVLDSLSNPNTTLHLFTVEELTGILAETGFGHFKHYDFGPAILFRVEKS